MPIEINLDRVRREREVGIRGLGQPLKSFRDRPVDFPVYQRGGSAEAYLNSLGPLTKPERGSKAGLGMRTPYEEQGEQEWENGYLAGRNIDAVAGSE